MTSFFADGKTSSPSQGIDIQESYEKQNYDEDQATVIDGAISEKVTTFKVSATTDLAANQRIIVDTEIMFIRSISGQNITVYRAYDNTIAAKHEHNASIGVLSATDNASIEFGDDFGFDEMTSFFADGKTSSPSQGIDIQESYEKF